MLIELAVGCGTVDWMSYFKLGEAVELQRGDGCDAPVVEVDFLDVLLSLGLFEQGPFRLTSVSKG